MSGNDIDTAGSLVWINSGLVDVFVLDDTGRRFPLGTLGDEQLALGFGVGPPIIAVPQYGADFEQFALSEDLLASPVLDFWREFVIEFLTDEDAANQLRATQAADLPAAIGLALEAELEVREQLEVYQRHARAEFDEQMVAESVARMEHSITHPRSPVVTAEHGKGLLQVIRHVADYTGFVVVDPGERLDRYRNPVKVIARVSNVGIRHVTLEEDWMGRPVLALLGLLHENGHSVPVALLPKRGHYVMQRAEDPEPVEIKEPAAIGVSAYEFYPPLPVDVQIKPRRAFALGLRHSGPMWGWVVAMSAVVTLLSLATPLVTQWVWGTIVPLRERDLLIEVGAALFTASVAAALFTIVQKYTVTRIDSIASLRVQAAIWSRMLGLPATFFRQYTTGDLATRIAATQQLALLLNASLVAQILGGVFSLANLILLFHFDSELAWVAVGILVVVVIAIGLIVIPLRRWSFGLMAADRAANGWMIQVLTGIQKIRMAGLEDRMTAMQVDRVRVMADMGARQTLELARFHAFFAAMGALVPFAFIVGIGAAWSGDQPPIETATYVAFLTAFGTMFGAVTAASGLVEPIALFGPMAEMAKPILDTRPDAATHLNDPGQLTGDIEFKDVVFHYPGATRPALDKTSFHARAGEFIAIVGTTGCGKSSIVRQLLGFEEPDSGEVLFDGRNLRDLDLEEVHAQLGVVLQDGQLSPGSMLENIIAGSPGANEAMAWRAAARAALLEDIEAMPLGMNTMVTPETVSGGQAQRILLARALLKDPAIMILDEATSALDNVSQAQVSESLADLGCTRIVIAHRLSSVRAADRILVLDQGKIVESGGYQELIDLGGLFASLVSRQVA